MLITPRSFDCELTGYPCENPGCTRRFCVDAHELTAKTVQARPMGIEKLILEEAEDFARRWAGVKGIWNPWLVSRFARNPRVIELAKQTVIRRLKKAS